MHNLLFGGKKAHLLEIKLRSSKVATFVHLHHIILFNLSFHSPGYRKNIPRSMNQKYTAKCSALC